MALAAAMLSSKRDNWETPPEIFERCDAEFRFDLDVCATCDNAKCGRYYTPEMDGLAQEWRGRCWMNPPYGREIGRWMKKAYEAAQTTADVVVCLVPARTDTAWWHEYAMRGEIRFLRKRVRFVGAPSCAPFPSALVVFRRRWWDAGDVSVSVIPG